MKADIKCSGKTLSDELIEMLADEALTNEEAGRLVRCVLFEDKYSALRCAMSVYEQKLVDSIKIGVDKINAYANRERERKRMWAAENRAKRRESSAHHSASSARVAQSSESVAQECAECAYDTIRYDTIQNNPVGPLEGGSAAPRSILDGEGPVFGGTDENHGREWHEFKKNRAPKKMTFDELKAWTVSHFTSPYPTDAFIRDFVVQMEERGWTRIGGKPVMNAPAELSKWWRNECRKAEEKKAAADNEPEEIVHDCSHEVV